MLSTKTWTSIDRNIWNSDWYFTPCEFCTPVLTVDFYWSLSESNSFQVYRTLLSILADLNSTVVWMGSILPLISSSASLFFRALGSIPRAPTIIGIIITFVFPNIFNSLVRCICLSFHFLSFSHNRATTAKFYLVSQSLRQFNASYFLRQILVCACSALSNFDFLHNSQWIAFPTHSYPLFYSFCASLVHSLILWWTILSLSSHNFCLLSIFAMI